MHLVSGKGWTMVRGDALAYLTSLNERGGFGFYELQDLLGHPPKTWRPR